jgi:hypothetical protein
LFFLSLTIPLCPANSLLPTVPTTQ